MKKFKRFSAVLSCLLLIIPIIFGVLSTTAFATSGASIAYRAHVADIGWQGYVYDGATAGTEGRSLQMEKLELRLGGVAGGIVANSHIQNIGWIGESSGSHIQTGTEGQGLRMEAISLKLSGEAGQGYSIVYRVHGENYGWQDWKKDGEVAGTIGQSLRIEAIQIRLDKKETTPSIAYRAHVADIGWQGYVYDGATAGTVGQGLQMEKLELRLGGASGNIVATSHVQNIGWMSYQGGSHIATGTEGQGLRMEAIRLWLEGNIANNYSIEYRTHVQNIGWQGWVRDGGVAGTEGQSLRIEAIEIRLVKKSGNAVTARLDQIADGSLKYNNSTEMRVGYKFTGTRAGEQCKGYAKNVFELCFGITPGSTKSNDYQLNSTNGMTSLGSKTGLNSGSASSIQSLFTNARPGDFVQMKRQPAPKGSNGPHSAIVYSVTTSGVTFLEANTDGKNGIFRNTYSWADLVAKNQAMSVYTATSYSLK